MAQTQSKKNELVKNYREGMAAAPHAFLVDFTGISVPQVTELRDKIRDEGGQYQVVKNTLALIAVKDQPLEGLREHFSGPTAVAFTDGDVVSLAKALTDFRQEAETIQFKGGLIAGRPVTPDQVEDIAKLPTREELMAKLLFLLQSPITRLARGLNAITRDFAVVLSQVAEKKSAE